MLLLEVEAQLEDLLFAYYGLSYLFSDMQHLDGLSFRFFAIVYAIDITFSILPKTSIHFISSMKACMQNFIHKGEFVLFLKVGTIDHAIEALITV